MTENTIATHNMSEGTTNGALNLFKVPKTDISTVAYRMVTIQPTTTGINPMEFVIPGLDGFTDLGRSYFTMELALKKDDGGNLVAAEKLWPANNLAHTIIKQIDLHLNGTLISPQSDTYHYKAYFESLLNFDRADGKTILRPSGWYNALDSPPEWTANNTNKAGPHQHYTDLPQNQKNTLDAMIAETAEYAGGRTRSLVFKPHLEVFHTGKVLVPGVEIKMKFHFNSPNLFMNGVGLAARLNEADIKIRFHMCQLRLNETVFMNLSAKREDGEVAVYPTVRSEIRTFSMDGALTRFDIPNLFQNRVPDRMIVGLVDSRAFNGAVTRDPFCFQKFQLTSIKQIVKGEEYPYETLQLVGNNSSKDLLGYFRFLLASGVVCKMKGNMVEQDDWGQGKGCTLFMFDNVASGCADSANLNPRQSGDLQLKLEFRAAPGSNITVIVYGEFENLIEIDKNRAVLYDIYIH